MALTLPALALAVEGDLAGLHPGHIQTQQLLPDLMTLLGIKLRILVHDVLEMVHHGAVGNEAQSTLQVVVAELPGIVAEETLCPGPCEEFHGHGVDFAAFHAGPDGGGGDPVTVGKACEGMACLVGHHFHVVGGTVEIGEDEGGAHGSNPGAVAAAGLAGFAFHIQHLMLSHELPESVGLRVELRVELVAHGQNFFGSAHGLGVAGAEGQRAVRKVQGEGPALHLGLTDVELLCHGDQILLHRIAEILDIFGTVAVALHPVVTQLGIAVIAQFPAHAVPELYQLVIDLVQFGTVLVVPVAFGSPCLGADLIIGIQLPGGQLAQGVDLTPEGDLGGGDELGVAGPQGIFLLQVLHDLRREGLGGHFSIDEGNGTVLFFQLCPEGGFQGGGSPGLEGWLELGHFLIVESHFGVVELVPGVDIPADPGQRDHGFVFYRGKFGFPVDLVGLFEGLGGRKTGSQVFHQSFPVVKVSALVGDLRKSHGKVLLPYDLKSVYQKQVANATVQGCKNPAFKQKAGFDGVISTE